jgi:hypothetical protein
VVYSSKLAECIQIHGAAADADDRVKYKRVSRIRVPNALLRSITLRVTEDGAIYS